MEPKYLLSYCIGTQVTGTGTVPIGHTYDFPAAKATYGTFTLAANINVYK